MRHVPTEQNARISEIFSSLQGEGVRIGERHLFVRFEECHLRCEYCDELDKPARTWTLDEVCAEVKRLDHEEGPHPYVSLTGGEPLLYEPFLSPLLRRLKQSGFRTYLETNGVLWQELEKVIDQCDLIAMDLKPASVTGERVFLKEHRRFLEIARRKETFIKIVLSPEIDIQEFQQLILLVGETAPQTPVILQPMSPVKVASGLFRATEKDGGDEIGDQETLQLLGELQRLAARMIPDVRILPRLHKILKIR